MFALALSGALWFAVWGGIHGWFPELQRRIVLAAVNDAESPDGMAIEIDRLGGSLIGGFEIEGLRIRPRTTPSSLAVDKLAFGVDVRALYDHRRVYIERLELDGVVFDWVVNGAEQEPAPTPVDPDADADEPGEETAEPWHFVIDELRLRDGRLRAAPTPAATLEPFEAEGSLLARGLSWRDDGSPFQFAELASDVRLLDATVGPLSIESGSARIVGTPEGMVAQLERVQAGIAERGRVHLEGQARVHFEDGIPDPTKVVIDSWKLDVSFRELDLAPLSTFALSDEGDPLPLPTTRLNGAARLTKPGPWRAEIQLDPSEVEGFAFQSGQANGQFDPVTAAWKLEDARFEAPRGRISAAGNGDIDRFERLELDLVDFPLETLQRLALAGEAPAESEVVTGHVAASARVSGPPAQLTGTLEADGVATVGERPTVEFEFAVALDEPNVLKVESVEIQSLDNASALRTGGPTEWRLVGQTVSTRDLTLEIRVASQDAGRLHVASFESDGTRHHIEAEFDEVALGPPLALFGQPVGIDGRLTGPIDFDTRSGAPAIAGQLEIQGPDLAGFRFDSLSLRAQTEGSFFTVTSRLRWNGEQPLALDMTLPAKAVGEDLAARLLDPETRIRLAVNDLSVAQLGALVPGELFEEGVLAGRLVGAFDLVGSEAGPNLVGQLKWNGARFGAARADDVALTAETNEGLLTVRFDITHQGKSALGAHADLELARLIEDPAGWLRDPRTRSEIVAEDVDLGWLVPRASARRLGRVESVEGLATGRVEVRGTPEGPTLKGRFEVEGAEIELALFDEPIGPIQAALSFDDTALRIERVVVGSKKGDAIVKGEYRWPRAGAEDDLELKADFKKFSLTHFPLLEARVSGDLKVNGPLSALDASGDLRFKRVHVSLPAPQDPLFREVRILGLEEPDDESKPNGESPKPSAYQTMQAQIAIDVQRGAKVRERGADLEVEGQILLRKRRLSPTLLQGSLVTTGGTYTFFGRTFEVREGVALFEERLPPDPDLRIEATRRIGDVTVGVRRVGRWSEPAAELFSEPPMGETDILSYLMFNKPRSQLGSEDDAQLNSATAQVASNLALAELTRALSAELPINEISMEVGEDLSVSSVGVETNVGEDIILRYDRALQDGVGDRFTVEWRFWKNLSLRSEYAEGGTSGLDLFWSYEY